MLRGGYRTSANRNRRNHNTRNRPRTAGLGWRSGGGGGVYSAPSAATTYSSEARQAPASNDTCYVFPWNEQNDCFDISANFQKEKSEGRITEQMLNSVFREIHSIRLLSPTQGEPLRWMAVIIFLLSVPLFFTYLFWGLFTNYYNYEIKQDGDKRYIEKTLTTSRFIEIPIIATACLVIGICVGFFVLSLAEGRDSRRLKRRAFIIRKILERHQRTTLEGTGCMFECSSSAAYIKLQLNFKMAVVPPANPTQAQIAANQLVANQAGGRYLDVSFNSQQVPIDTIQLLQRRHAHPHTGVVQKSRL